VAKSSSFQKGRAGEQAAEEKLQALGYRILQRNYRCKKGEIDLVARHEDELVFIEVKTRRQGESGSPEEFVHAEKRRKLARTALAYLSEHHLMEEPCRFDVVSVKGQGSGNLTVEIIRSAFVVE